MNNKMNTCRVEKCNFKDSHVSSGHRCNSCKKFGHGQLECCKFQKIYDLKNSSKHDTMMEGSYCNLDYCDYRWSHNKDAHHCGKCYVRGHDCSNCPNKYYDMSKSPRTFDNKPIIEKKKTKIEKVKCPKCRQFNIHTTPKKIFVDTECIVCYSNNAQVLFQTCSHICVCIKCYDKLDKYQGDISISSSSSSSSSSSLSSPRSSRFSSSSSSSSSSSYSSSSSSHNLSENDEDFAENALNKMGITGGQIYVHINSGIGCSFLYRRSSPGSPLDKLFMHSDDWGQYGTGRFMEYCDFIRGYTKIS